LENTILTVSQVAEYLKLSEKTIRRLITSGQLKASKIGSSWRVQMIDIKNYLEANTNGKEQF